VSEGKKHVGFANVLELVGYIEITLFVCTFKCIL